MLSIILAPVYLLVNFYILRWLLRFLDTCFLRSDNKILKVIISVFYTLLSTSLLTGFLLPVSPVQKFAARAGNYWLGTFLYILLTVFLMDLLRIVVKRVGFLQRFMLHSRKMFIFSGVFCIGFVTAVSLYGGHNARNIRTTRYDIRMDSELYGQDHLKIALVADMHMGYSIGYHQVERMVNEVNAIQPELVCIAGDIFDNHYESLDDPQRIRKALSKIQSTYGVFACYGNHDYEEKILAGFTFSSNEKVHVGEQMRELLEAANIRTLEDEAVLIDDKFYLVGRKDYSSKEKSGNSRKTPEELVKGLDTSKPVIVMDHQPRELEELARAGVDLDLCGHTHDGQMFPGNIVTGLMWENSRGYLKKGDMHNIVTSGVGVFGPYMRVGTKSEIVEINIDFH